MLLDDLKKANIEAMKAKDTVARGAYSVVISKSQLLLVELHSKGNELQDSDVLGIIQKTLKELSDEKEGYSKVGNQEKVDAISKQEEILKGFLPKQLSREEIIAEIAKLEDKSMPSVMKHFKANFAGKVDMSLVSQIARGQ